MAIWSSEIKELEKLYESIKGQLPDLEKELAQLIHFDDPNVLMLYSRRSLEVIITDLCECELKRPRKTEPLKGIIDKLHKEDKVPAHIITSMHGLNELSNYGAHPKNFDPEQVKPVLVNLDIIIKWYLKYKETGTNIKTKPAEVIKSETSETRDAKKSITASKKRLIGLLTVIIVIIAIVFAILFFTEIIGSGTQTKGLEKSIAVLPFKNLSNDTEQEYFSEGLVEEILDRLCRVSALKVISRTSSERFKNTNLSLKEIAGELGASAIMEGSVQKNGNNIRITVQLIDAKTDTHLWSRIYDKSFSDIFSIYSDVAQAVAKELSTTITQQEKRLIARVPTTDMTAYEAYFMGKFHNRQLNQKDLETAMQFFELAKERDPKFALAYAGISRVWGSRQQMGLIKSADAAPKAEAAIMKALELDSTQSEVHNTMAAIKVWTRWDWKGGEASFRKAIELNPSNADAHSVYSHLLNILGRQDEAMKHIEIALELDPLNPKIKSFYGIDLMFLHRYDDAVTAFREALDLNPLQGVAENITPALFLAGREEEAFKMAKNRWKNNKEYLRALDEGYAEAGFQGGCKRLADFRAANLKTTYSNPIALTTIYSMAGDTSNALFWLEKAYEEHNPNMPYLLNPLYDKLRDNPRFQEIARKMNLPYR